MDLLFRRFQKRGGDVGVKRVQERSPLHLDLDTSSWGKVIWF